MVTTGDIQKIIEESIAETDIFIVEIKMIPGKIMVFLDKPAGITIQECGRICRNLLNTLEPTGVLETNDVDVSSPGMDFPLRVLPQYKRHVGKNVKVKMLDKTERTGLLKAYTEQNITIEETIIKKEAKKKVITVEDIILPFADIKEVTLVISFK